MYHQTLKLKLAIKLEPGRLHSKLTPAKVCSTCREGRTTSNIWKMMMNSLGQMKLCALKDPSIYPSFFGPRDELDPRTITGIDSVDEMTLESTTCWECPINLKCRDQYRYLICNVLNSSECVNNTEMLRRIWQRHRATRKTERFRLGTPTKISLEALSQRWEYVVASGFILTRVPPGLAMEMQQVDLREWRRLQ